MEWPEKFAVIEHAFNLFQRNIISFDDFLHIKSEVLGAGAQTPATAPPPVAPQTPPENVDPELRERFKPSTYD